MMYPTNIKNTDIITTNLKAFLENLSSTDLINNWLTIAIKKPAKIIKQLKTLNPFAETKTSNFIFWLSYLKKAFGHQINYYYENCKKANCN